MSVRLLTTFGDRASEEAYVEPCGLISFPQPLRDKLELVLSSSTASKYPRSQSFPDSPLLSLRRPARRPSTRRFDHFSRNTFNDGFSRRSTSSCWLFLSALSFILLPIPLDQSPPLPHSALLQSSHSPSSSPPFNAITPWAHLGFRQTEQLTLPLSYALCSGALTAASLALGEPRETGEPGSVARLCGPSPSARLRLRTPTTSQQPVSSCAPAKVPRHCRSKGEEIGRQGVPLVCFEPESSTRAVLSGLLMSRTP
jgi:hypothetical protein